MKVGDYVYGFVLPLHEKELNRPILFEGQVSKIENGIAYADDSWKARPGVGVFKTKADRKWAILTRYYVMISNILEALREVERTL